MELVTVETASGAIAGVQEDGQVAFRGIPYAAAPVGALRWRSPQPVEPWTGVLEATEYAPLGPQPPPDLASSIPGDPAEQSEDCLYLNITTPACDSQRRPVMVWIHGGGFVSGSSSSALYANGPLVSHGVVLVSIAYRLGALGWLAHPNLVDPADPEGGFGNWGLRDQVAALEWVKDNIASFGGDPDQVTAFGESAGGMAVAVLLATDAPGRLFSKAIIESGAAAALGQGSASRVAEEVARELGFETVSREALLEVPADQILAAQLAVGPRYEVLGLPFQPTIDGGLLTAHPAARIAAGSAAGVSVMVGTNRDEWGFWSLANPALRELDEERLLQLVAHQLEGSGIADSVSANDTVEVYREARIARGDAAGPSDLHSALSTDWIFRVPSMRLASAPGTGFERVFTYLFDWESPFGDGILGACHALELPFVFGSFANPFVAIFSGGGEDAEQLSLAMQAAWTSFATTGDPSSEIGGIWPAYDTTTRSTKRFGPVVDVVNAPIETERAWLDQAWGPFGEFEARAAELVKEPRASR